jgi:hypothetical protein
VRQRIAAFGSLDLAIAAHCLVATRRIASPTGFYGAVRVAGLRDIRNVQAGIALLHRRNQDTVATDRHARRAWKRTLIAELNLTG